jgi:hypothetical protein
LKIHFDDAGLVNFLRWKFVLDFVWVMPKSLKDCSQPPELAITLRMWIVSFTSRLPPSDVPSSNLCQMKTRLMSSS